MCWEYVCVIGRSEVLKRVNDVKRFPCKRKRRRPVVAGRGDGGHEDKDRFCVFLMCYAGKRKLLDRVGIADSTGLQ